MNKKIKLPFKQIPNMEDDIIDAIDNNKLIIFVGAGVSKLYGYPLWRELGENLAKKAVKERTMNLSEKEVLLGGGYSPMEIVTIASRRLDSIKENYGINSIVELLSTKVNENTEILNKVSKYLSAYNAPIITTNADLSLDNNKYLSDRYTVQNFEDFQLGPYIDLSIIHLHGCISDPKNMVFTSESYAEAYRVDSEFGKNLSKLFNNNGLTILFLGYGISEFELLRYFLKDKNNEVKKLFFLNGYLGKDLIKYKIDKEYYSSLGIKLLPFSREKHDYLGLVDVLKEWNKDVTRRTLASSVKRKNTIEKILSMPPSKEGLEIVKKMAK